MSIDVERLRRLDNAIDDALDRRSPRCADAAYAELDRFIADNRHEFLKTYAALSSLVREYRHVAPKERLAEIDEALGDQNT